MFQILYNDKNSIVTATCIFAKQNGKEITCHIIAGARMSSNIVSSRIKFLAPSEYEAKRIISKLFTENKVDFRELKYLGSELG